MKRLLRLWIYKFGFGLLIAMLVTGISYPNTSHAESIATDGIAIKWSNGASLEFFGTPNEVQSGEVSFIIEAGPKCKLFELSVKGTAFSEQNSILDTEYQADGEPVWHKAGDTFTIHAVSGKTLRIRFRAVMGSDITSQKAGTYNAKISVHVVSAQ